MHTRTKHRHHDEHTTDQCDLKELKHRLVRGNNLRMTSDCYNHYYLCQKDFKYGTVILEKSGVYHLTEDIIFNPNSLHTIKYDGIPEYHIPPNPNATPYDLGVGEPHPAQYVKYNPAAYGIGFFAAIVIQGDSITLDLNEHCLKQSKEHNLQQRFYANIELASQPFIPKQGPHDFGSTISCAYNCSVINGRLGLSSHHGIHGNCCRCILLQNLECEKYEVAAISINGYADLVIRHCCAKRTNTKIPVLGIFSAGRFLRPYVNQLAVGGKSLDINGVLVPAVDIRQQLKYALNTAYDGIINHKSWWSDKCQTVTNTYGETVNPSSYYKLFNNPTGLIDGNTYGIVLNSKGAAVSGFPKTTVGASHNTYLSHIKVHKVKGKIIEVPALVGDKGGPQIDPIGAVFQTRNKYGDNYLTITKDGKYKGNVVANTQLLVTKYKADIVHLSVSRDSITQQTLNWATGVGNIKDFKYLLNGDAMFHVNKGVIGYKIDGINNVYATHCYGKHITNLGDSGSEINGNYKYNHPGQSLPGYGGACTRGITLSSTQHAFFKHCEIDCCVSKNSLSVGCDIMFESRYIKIYKCAFENIITKGKSYKPPTIKPECVGVLIHKKNKHKPTCKCRCTKITPISCTENKVVFCPCRDQLRQHIVIKDTEFKLCPKCHDIKKVYCN